ncbi:conserved protein [Tepidicaulis marinus]|uniref:Conserved protein n=1 Tax=Tepidicaulis marinus TaxID=1333998 RepID=A0A081B6C5_9HYPH|nr:phage tail assembly protein [Tepidicaulis marinus]GAK43593.1 conserved protein [Tepidicaulis marinus]
MKHIKLDHPVTVNGTTIRDIKMRRPKVRDELAAQTYKEEAERELMYFCSLTELTREELEELDLADWGKLQKAFEEMLQPGKPGEPPLPDR